MLKLVISCWYDGVVEACRYMFVMGSDVVLVLLLLYSVSCILISFPLPFAQHFCLRVLPHLSVCMLSLFCF